MVLAAFRWPLGSTWIEPPATAGGGEGVAGGSQCAVDDDLGSPVVGIEVHGVAGGKAQGPIVGDRLAVGEQDGNVGCRRSRLPPRRP